MSGKVSKVTDCGRTYLILKLIENRAGQVSNVIRLNKTCNVVKLLKIFFSLQQLLSKKCQSSCSIAARKLSLILYTNDFVIRNII